jgi:hypothetical protein
LKLLLPPEEPWTGRPNEGVVQNLPFLVYKRRFGMGMGAMHVSTRERRDRLWLINAFAVVLLTLLGAAGEALGYDQHLKSTTSTRRTHSLFCQGSMALWTHPHHAGESPRTPARTICPNAGSTAGLRDVRCNLK